MSLATELYAEQVKVWPKDGRHIVAQFDDDTVIVYALSAASADRARAVVREAAREMPTGVVLEDESAPEALPQ